MIPVAVQDILGRHDRHNKSLPPGEQRQVVALMTESGISGITALTYMAQLVRYRLGVGNYPIAPGTLAWDEYSRELVERRADTIVTLLQSSRT